MDPEALIALVVLPDALELRHDLPGEQFGRVARLLRRHVADVNPANDVADAQSLDQLFHPLPHGLRAAGDDIAALVELAPREARREPQLRAGQLVQELGLDRPDRAV